MGGGAESARPGTVNEKQALQERRRTAAKRRETLRKKYRAQAMWKLIGFAIDRTHAKSDKRINHGIRYHSFHFFE